MSAAAEVAYEEAGSGRPLVLSSSLGTTRDMWDPQWAPLSRRFRTIRYDMRGHGASPAPPGPWRIADFGADALALLDRLGLERVSWCGLSLGGMIGMWLAANAPDRIDRLVLCCTSPHMPPASILEERAAAVREAGTVDTVADATLDRWLTKGFRQAEPETAAWLRAMVAGVDPEAYALACEALAAMDLREDLPLIQTPTLVISGTDDPTTPPDHGKLIAELIDGARLEIVPGVAHIGSLERPETFTELIAEHVQEGESS